MKLYKIGDIIQNGVVFKVQNKTAFLSMIGDIPTNEIGNRTQWININKKIKESITTDPTWRLPSYKEFTEIVESKTMNKFKTDKYTFNNLYWTLTPATKLPNDLLQKNKKQYIKCIITNGDNYRESIITTENNAAIHLIKEIKALY